MKNTKRTGAAAALLVVSAGFMAAGAARGELPVIFIRAVKICLECIGLG